MKAKKLSGTPPSLLPPGRIPSTLVFSPKAVLSSIPRDYRGYDKEALARVSQELNREINKQDQSGSDEIGGSQR